MSKQIEKVVIIGAGLMGASIGQSFPEYGLHTTIYSNQEADFQRARTIIRDCQKTLTDNGVLSCEKSAQLQSDIRYSTNLACVEDADLIVEAIPEDLELKKQVLGEVSKRARKDAIITSNTSAISINVLSEWIVNPERFCGTHWLNPPHIIPLVEITKSKATSLEVVDTLYDFFQNINKKPVILQKDVKGFISNRLQFALLREATYLVESGVATPEDIDKTLRYGNGLRYTCSGPFKIVDFGGVGVFNSVAQYLYEDLNCEKKENQLLKSMVEKGYQGVENGMGFYTYTKESALEETRVRDKKMLDLLKM